MVSLDVGNMLIFDINLILWTLHQTEPVPIKKSVNYSAGHQRVE